MIDLHLHLDGSLGAEELLDIANNTGIKLPTADAAELKRMLSADEGCIDLKEYLDKFDLPLKVLQTTAGLERAVYLLIKRLSEQGLLYAEIRFAPQLHLSRGLTQEEVVEAAVRGLNWAKAEFGMPAQLILCCMRMKNNAAENTETVETARKFIGKGVCAVDLAGNENDFPTEDFRYVFELAKKYNIPVTIHAGEAAGAESVAQALSLGAVRIGHGIHASEDKRVMERLKKGAIPLEICYTSNIQTGAAETPEKHPIEFLYRQGIKLTVNTDNMAVSDTTLKKEYLRLKKIFGFTNRELMQFTVNAAQAAFVSDEMRSGLIAGAESGFEKWIS